MVNKAEKETKYPSKFQVKKVIFYGSLVSDSKHSKWAEYLE